MEIRQIRMSIFEENMLGEGPGIKAGDAGNLRLRHHAGYTGYTVLTRGSHLE